MRCSKCGMQLSEDAGFCPECGTPVERTVERAYGNPRQDDYDQQFASQPGGISEHRRLITLIVLLLAVIAAMLVTIAVLLMRRDADKQASSAAPTAAIPTATSTAVPLEDEGKASARDSANAQDSAQAVPTSEPVTYSSPCITITMPAKYVDMGASWVTTDRYMALEVFDMQTGSRVLVASIPWDERASVPYEVKEERWDLGPVTDGGVVSQAVLHISYVDGEGKTIYGGADTQSDTLACAYYLGCSPEEILSWIATNGDQTAGLESAEDDTWHGDGISGRTAPFWGVWAYASKDLGEAVGFAQGAASEGFAAEVFLTTDWANLNDEPWYVVSLGCVSSEGEAYDVLARAQSGSHPDAYVKYSGDYVA